MNLEYIMYPIIVNTINQFKSDNMITNTLYLLIFFIIMQFKNIIKIDNTINYIKTKIFTKKKYTIIFESENDYRSMDFKSIMHYMITHKKDNIKQLKDLTIKDWNDNIVETIYEIYQDETFQLDDNIYGNISHNSVERRKHKYSDDMVTKDVCTLNVYSQISLDHLIKWIDIKYDEYQLYLKNKSQKTQLLLTITFNKKLNVDRSEWDSTITFDNSFLQNKKEILNKIDFFLNNKQWYIEKGIPYNLGILLYGEPGCGKTRFIKQLINYTKRHGIDIKLNDGFNFNVLQELIFNENIDDEYIIPQDKRIIIFEDIDAMGDIVKSRNYKDKKKNKSTYDDSDTEEDVSKPNNPLEMMFSTMKDKDSAKKDDNNLSYLLNILDGLNECSGRIIVMTTNKKDHLDPALIRPGRIDIMINFTKLSKSDVCEFINTFWKINIKTKNIKDDIECIYTSAELINIFRNTDNFDNIKSIFIK